MAQKKKKRIKARRQNFADKIIAAALSASTVLAPLPAAASDLTVHDSYKNSTTVTKSSDGKKFTVTTSKKNGDAAFNRFSAFTLDKGHIANMVLPGGTSKLYNFVDAKIDVQGTVNALKAEAKKIGGHLLFISPKGMIVGEQGAINAGKFSAIIADQSTYDAILGQSEPWAHAKFKLMDQGYVALDKAGSIVVKGRVSAPGGIELKAAKIETAAGAKLDTRTLDFGSLVKLDDISGSGVSVNADSLKLTRDGDGSVRLEAIAADGGEAKIEHAGAIEAAGSVVMRARASGAPTYDSEADKDVDAGKKETPFTGTPTFNAAPKATVTAKSGSTVSADGDIFAAARVWNYREDTFFGEKGVNVAKELLDDFSGVEIDGSYTNLKTEAVIAVESGARLHAGKDLKLHAESLVGVKAGTSVGFLELVKYDWSNKVPAAGVIVSNQTGTAAVTISGDISAGADMKIDARSVLNTSLTATAAPKNFDQQSPFTIALLWADLDNTAGVTVAKGAKVKAGGALTVASTVANDITTQATSLTQAHAPGSTALNATFVTTGARTDIGADLTAGGTVSLTALDDTGTWTVGANNRTSTALFFGEQLKANLTGPIYKSIYGRLANKIGLPEQYRYGSGNAAGGDNYGSKWGFAVMYTGVDFFDGSAPSQSANLTVAPGVKIVTPGDIRIDAASVVGDHHWTSMSAVGGSDFTSQDERMSNSYSFAITYDRAKLEASVDIGQGAQMNAGGDIDIQSSARVEWDRVGRLIDKLREDWEQLKSYATGEESMAAWEEANKYLGDDYHDADLSNWQGFKNYSTAIGGFIGGAFTYLGTVTSAIQFIPDAMEFLDFASYANVYGRSVAVTNNGDKSNGSGGGSFTWPNWSVSNTVGIARGVRLSAGGDLSVRGTTRSDMALIGGVNANLIGGIIAKNTGSGVGGTILIDSFDTQNDVNVHKGAVLESGRSMKLTANDSSMQLVANLSAAKAGKFGFQGQLNVLAQSLSGRVRADDEATLKAPSITISSESENYVTNSAIAIQTADDKALGFAVAIDALTFESVARVADFDAIFSDDTNPVTGAFIAADALNVNAYTGAHVNTVAVAGSAAKTKEEQGGEPQSHWYDAIVNLPGNILKGSKSLGDWIGGKISTLGTGGANPEDANINNAANNGANQVNPDVANNANNALNNDQNNVLDNANNNPGGNQQNSLNLAVSGSVAWNFADYIAHAGLEGTNARPLTIKGYSGGASNRSVKVESQADKWQAAFSGAAAAAFADDGNPNVNTVGVAGTLSVNSGKSVVSADLANASLTALDGSKGATRDAVTLSAGSTGRTVAGALGLALTTGSDQGGTTVAANVGVNTLNNIAHATVSGAKTAASGTTKPVSADLDVLSYASDTQVTGGIDIAVGKAKRAVGAGVQVAVIKNDLASTVKNSTLTSLGNVSIDSYLKVTQVAAGIAVAAGVGGSDGSWAGAGSIVVDTLINKAAAGVQNSDLSASGSFHIAAGDGADIDARVEKHKASASFDHEVKRTAASIDAFVKSDAYYKGAELETKDYYKKFTQGSGTGPTTTVDQTLTGRTGASVVAGALSGSGTSSGSAVGAAVVVNNLRSTMDVTIEGSTVKAASATANSENGTALIGIAAGASVGGDGWGAYGSVLWNSIVNTAHTTFKNSNITITGSGASSLTAQNRALSVGVAGAVGVSFGGLAAGFSLSYSHVTNDAVLSVTGGDKKTLSAAGGSLSAVAQNAANSWVAGFAVPVSTGGGAGGGTGALHRITGETSSVFDGMTISGLKDLDVRADEKSSAKTLSGAVSVSTSNAAVSGALAVTQVGVVSSEDQAHTLHAALKNSAVTMAEKAGKLNVSTSDDATIVNVSIGGGYGNAFAAGGAISVNLLHRRGLAEIAGSSITGRKTAVTMTGTQDTTLDNIGLQINASSSGAIGGSIVVNRIGDENLISVTGTRSDKMDVGSLYSLARSDTWLLNVGLGIAGGSSFAGQGMVLVNSMSPTTCITIDGVTVTAADSLAAVAQSDAELRNYVGQGAGGGTGAGAGLIQVNYINDNTVTLVKNAALTAGGSGTVSVSNDIADGDIDNTKMGSYAKVDAKDEQNADDFAKSMPSSEAVYDNAFQGLFDSKTLRKQRKANTYSGLVIDASSTHVLTDAALTGAGAGTAAGAGGVNIDILTGKTAAQTIDSDLASSGDLSVHASDFSNTSGVFIAGAGASTGAGAGLVNVRSTKREVDASMKSSALGRQYALNVSGTAAAGAVSKQSLTSFEIAGAGAMGAGALQVNVDVQRGTTTAVIDGAKGSVGGLLTAADHFTRVGQIEVAGAGGMGAGAIMVSVAVDKSRTAAQVLGSSLDVTGGNVNIDALNRIKGYTVTVTGAGGIGAGTIGVGVNYGSAQVDASLLNSQLGTAKQRAGDVSIAAHNTADLLTVAATASGGVGAGSILVNIDDLYSDVGVDVSNSQVYAKNINISADEDYKLRAHAWGASGGVGAGLIYVQALNIGEDEPYSDPEYDKQLGSVSASKSSALDKVQKFLTGESGDVSSGVLSAKEAQIVKQERNADTDIKQSRGSTLHISVGEASLLDASNNIRIGGVESTDIISYQGGITGGVGAGAVNLSFMSVRKQSGIAIDSSRLNAVGTVTISSVLQGDNDQHVIQGLGGLGVAFAAYGRLTNEAGATITAKNSHIAGAKGVTLSSLNSTINESYGAGGALAGVAIGGIVARAISTGDVRVAVDGGSLTSSSGTVSLAAERTGETFAQEVFGYIGFTTGLGSDAKASETTNVSVTLGSAAETSVTAQKLAVHSELNPYVHARVHQHGGSLSISAGVPLAEAVLKGGSTVNLGANNVYSVPAISVESFVGGADDPLRMFADTHSYGGTIVGIEYQYSRAIVTNDTTAAISMNGGAFDSTVTPALSLHAMSSSALSADIETLRVGGLTIGSSNNAAKVYDYGRAKVSMTNAAAQTLASLDVKAESVTDTRTIANGDGGGAIYFDDISSSSGGAKAAWGYNEVKNEAAVDIGGSWFVTGDARVTAAQSAKTDDKVDAVMGGVIVVNGIQHDLKLDGKARIGIKNGAMLIAGGALVLDAVNSITDNPDNHYTTSGNTYGPVAGNAGKNYTVVRQSADIELGAKARVMGDKATTLTAHSGSVMNEYTHVVTGGVGAGSGAVNDFQAAWHNTVTVDSEATLGQYNSDNSDTTIALWNKGDLRATAIGNLQLGLVGGATSFLDAVVDRSNIVTISGTVNAGRDVIVVAGREADGFGGTLDMTSISQAYAHSIGGAGADLDRTIDQTNTITVESGGSIHSTRHSSLSTRPGDVKATDMIERYAWIGPSKKSGSIASTALGDYVSGLNTTSTVTVDGTVEAGADNKFVMHVSDGFAMLEETSQGAFRAMDWVDGKLYLKRDKNGNYIQGTADDYEFIMTGAGMKTPSVTIERGSAAVRLGLTREYDSYLYDRLEELEKLLEASESHATSTAHQSYLAERAQIIATLASYGLPATRPAEGKKGVPLMVPWVEVSPVSVSGGNVTIRTNSLKGKGTLNANGSPEISIDNASNMALKLNGLSILSAGGEVIVNNASVKNAADLKSRVTAAASFGGTVIANTGDGAAPDITVKNTGSASSAKFTMSDKAGQSQQVEYAVISDIENLGGIVNYPGAVNISTAAGSIRSVGADIIAGKGVKLEAPRGSISINSKGILNVDTAPESVYGRFLQECLNRIDINDWKGLNISTTTKVADLIGLENADFGTPGHIVSGGNIFITAETININGTIQSGFGTYNLNLAGSLAAKIADFDQTWGKKPVIIPDDPAQLSAYQLTAGGVSYDKARGEYVSSPATWYNPSTGNIVVEDIVGAGGTIYLTGKIINTNVWDSLPDAQLPGEDGPSQGYWNVRDEHRGRIIAFTGASEVNIESALETTLRLGRIDARSTPARIVINDTAKPDGDKPYTTTEYTSENGALSVKYTPNVSMRYFLNFVAKKTTTEKYVYKYDFDWWSDSWNEDKKSFLSYSRSTPDSSVQMLPGAAVMSMSEFIAQKFQKDKLSDEDYNYFKAMGLIDHPEMFNDTPVLYFIDVKSTTDGVKPANWPNDGSEWVEDIQYDNWTHFSGRITHSKSISYGNQMTFTRALRAGNPISVSIRESANPGVITIKAEAADVLLGDTIRSDAAGTGRVSITAKNIIGANDTTLIVADTIDLKAAGDIKTGMIDPLHVSGLGGSLTLRADAGEHAWLQADRGDVHAALTAGSLAELKAAGSIDGSASAATVSLESDGGSIGTKESPFSLNGTNDTVLTALAQDTINIVKAKGDMRVVCVETPGDVTLTTSSGSIVDAYPTDRDQTMTDEQLIQHWKDAGLIAKADGSSVTAEMRDENVAKLENMIRAEYQSYQSTRTQKERIGVELASLDIDPGSLTPEEAAAAKTRLTALQASLASQLVSYDKYAGVTDIDAYIATQKTTAGTTLYELVNIKADEVGGWTDEYLLYAVQDSVLNPGPGTVKSDALPSIFGRSVTLNSGADIGAATGEERIAGGSALLDNDKAGLKKLSQASPANVTWDDDKNEFVISNVNEVALETDGLTAKAAGDIYIASPTRDLPISTVESTGGGTIHLTAGGDLKQSGADKAGYVIGGNMYLAAAGPNSDIGGQVIFVEQTKPGSVLRASAGGSIVIQADNSRGIDLTLGSIAAGKSIDISTYYDGVGLLMSEGQGRLNAPDIRLTTKNAKIGTSDAPIRIQNASANDFSHIVKVDNSWGADGQTPSVYLQGERGLLPEGENGWLTIGSSKAGSIEARSEGGIATSGDLKLTDAGALAHLTASGDVQLLGTINAAGGVQITAGGSALLSGDTQAKALFVNASGDITARSLTVTDNAVLTASGDMNVTGSLTGGDLTLSAGGTALVNGSLTGGAVTVTAGGNVGVSGSAAAAKKLTVDAGEIVLIVGDAASSGDVELRGSGIMGAGSISADNLLMEASRDGLLVLSDITVSGDTVVRSNQGDVRVGWDSSTLKTGDLIVEAGGAASVGSSVDVSGSVTVTASGDVDFYAPVTAENSVYLTSQTKSVKIYDDITAKDLTIAASDEVNPQHNLNVTETAVLRSAGDVKVGQNGKTLTAGSLIVEAGGAAQVSSDVHVNDSLSVTASGDVDFGAPVASGSSIYLTSQTAKVIIHADITAKNLTIAASDEVNPQYDLTASEKAELKSAGDVKVGQSGKKLTAGTLIVEAGGTANLRGDVEVDGVLTAKAGGDVLFGENVQAAGDIDLTSLGGSVVLDKDISARNLSITAPGDVNPSRNIDVTGTVSLTSTHGSVSTGQGGTHLNSGRLLVSADGAATLAGAVSAAESVDVTSRGDVTFAGSVQASHDIALRSLEGSVIIERDISADNLTIVAASSIIPEHNIAVSFDTVLKSGGNVQVGQGGTYLRTGVLSVEAGGEALLDGDVSAAKTVDVTASGDVLFGASVQASGDIALRSTGGSVAILRDICADNLLIAAKEAVAPLHDITVAHDAVLLSSGDVLVGNRLESGNLYVEAGGSAALLGSVTVSGELEAAAGGDVTFGENVSASGDIALTSQNGYVYIERDITARNLSIAASGSIEPAHDIDVFGTVSLTSTGSYVNVGNTVSADTLNIAAADYATVGGSVNVASGVSVTASGDVKLEADVTAAGEVMLNSSGGGVAVSSDIFAAGLTIAASGDISLDHDVEVAGTTSLTTTGRGNVNVLGTLSGDVLVVSSGGSAFLSGDVDVNASLDVAADGYVLFGDNVSASGDISLKSENNVVAVGSDITANNLTIDSSGAIALFNSVNVKNSTVLSTDADMIVGGPLKSCSASLAAGGSVTLFDTLTAEDALDVTAGGIVYVDGAVSSAGEVNVKAGESFLIRDGSVAADKLTVAAGGGIEVHGDMDVSSDLTLEAGTDILLDGGAVSARTATLRTEKRDIEVSAVLSADVLTVSSAADTALAGVKAGTLSAGAGGSFSADTLTAGTASISASGDVTVTGNLRGGGLTLAAGQNAAVAGAAEAEALTVTSGADTALADVKAGTLEATAGGSITAANVTADTADLSASGDVSVTGNLSGGGLTVTAGQNASVAGTAEADTLTVTSGADTALADVKAGTLEAAAGGSITTTDVTAESANLSASSDVTVSGNLSGGGLTVTAGKNASVAGTADADTLTVTSGADTALAAVKAGMLAARSGGSLTAGDVNADTVGLSASGDVSVTGKLGGGDLTLAAGKNVSVAGAADADALSVTSGADTTLNDVNAGTLAVNAGGAVTTGSVTAAASASLSASGSAAVNGSLTGGTLSLSSGSDITVTGTVSGDTVTTLSSGATTLRGSVRAQTLSAGSFGTLSTKDVTADTAQLSSWNGVDVDGDLSGKEVTVMAQGKVAVTGTTMADTLFVASYNSDTALGEVDAGEVTTVNGGRLTAKNVRADSTLTTAAGGVEVSETLDSGRLELYTGESFSTRELTTKSGDLFVWKDAVVEGSLNGGDLNVFSGGDTVVRGDAHVDDVIIMSLDDARLNTVTARSLGVAAFGSISAENVTAETAGLLALGDVNVARDLKANELEVDAGGSIAVGGTTGGETVTLTSGSDTTLNDVAAQKLTSAAGDSFTAANVTAGTADITASNDVSVKGDLTAEELTVVADRNISVGGTTGGGTVTLTSGAGTKLNDVAAQKLISAAGDSFTAANVTAGTAGIRASNDVSVSGLLSGGDVDVASGADTKLNEVNVQTFNVRSGGSITAANVTAGTTEISASNDVSVTGLLSGGDVNVASGVDTKLNEVNVQTLNVRSGGSIMATNVTAGTADIRASNDVSVSGLLSGGDVDVASGADTRLNEVNVQTLDVRSGGSITTANVTAGTAAITALRDVSVARDLNADGLEVDAGGSITVDSTTGGETVTLTSGAGTKLNAVQAKTLDARSGGSFTASGAVNVSQAAVTASADIGMTCAANDLGTLTANAGGDLSVNDKNDLTLTAAAGGSLTANAGGSLNVADGASSGSDMTLSAGEITTGSLSAGGSLKAAAQGELTMTGDAAADGDLYLTAHEISVRSLNAGKFLTALSETAFTGDDLTADGDVRVHTYGDMTFNDATAGGSAWILGLGSSAARIRFHEVRASGQDTAVLLERGYLDFWRVTAGLDGAVGVRHFEGPRLAGELITGSKIRVYFPYGGSLMPKNPFNFHVRDLLRNPDVDPYDRDSVNMWPPRDRRVLDLRAGSDDIEINLDEYDYWLPEEIVDMEAGERPLSVSGK